MGPEILAANSTGTQRLLEYAGQHGIPFLFASSCEAYGKSQKIPLVEDDCGVVDTLGARVSYEIGKRSGEALTWIYGKKFNFPVKIIRIFHAYGEGMIGSRLIPYLIQTALNNETFVLHGNGQQTRCFCYVEDIVEGLLLAMQHKNSMLLNMGSQEEVSINEVAHLVLELMQSDFDIEYTDLPKDDPPQRVPDISRAREILNWQPTTTLREGIAKNIEWYHRYLSLD